MKIDLTKLALSVLVLGITATIGASVLTGIRDSQLTSLPVVSYANESVTLDTSGNALANVWGKEVSSIYNVTNVSDPLLIPSSGYTTDVNSVNGIVTVYPNATYNQTASYVNYDVYNTADPRFSLSDSAATGLGEYGNWFKILVIVGVAAVILGLIFMAFGNTRKQEDSM